MLRPYDYAGRYGGEEFLLVVPGTSGTEGVYERVRQVVEHRAVSTEAGQVHVTVSIGVAAGLGDSTPEGIFAEADTALYQAKEQGRNRVVCGPSVSAQSRHQARRRASPGPASGCPPGTAARQRRAP